MFISIFNSLILNPINCDVAEPWQLDFQDPATPIHEGIIDLHNEIMAFLVFIFVLVSTFMVASIHYFSTANYQPKMYYYPITHHVLLEFVWTALPSLLLIAIAFPSFSLIYSMDDILEAQATIKIIGHQWYWEYEYGEIGEDTTVAVSDNNEPIKFDSYMIPESDLVKGQFRLLEVDNRLLLPTQTHLRLLVTSADVIHSWAVPSLGIKVDACPGRLNQMGLFIKRPGLFYGQCSEICGVNHAFMPICVEAI